MGKEVKDMLARQAYNAWQEKAKQIEKTEILGFQKEPRNPSKIGVENEIDPEELLAAELEFRGKTKPLFLTWED